MEWYWLCDDKRKVENSNLKLGAYVVTAIYIISEPEYNFNYIQFI